MTDKCAGCQEWEKSYDDLSRKLEIAREKVSELERYLEQLTDANTALHNAATEDTRSEAENLRRFMVGIREGVERAIVACQERNSMKAFSILSETHSKLVSM